MATNTAASFTDHTGNGSVGPFTVSFSYLSQAEVDVTVGNVLKTINTHYTFTSANQITFTSGNAPGNGVAIRFQRDTAIGSKKVDFVDGSVLTEADLDTNSDQLLFSMQEIVDSGAGSGVNSVAGTSPIVSSGGTTPAISITAATTSAAGSMSASDKSKLDGIESSATADQTGAEIKSAYEGESNTNAFTDAEKSKLAAIEASADVTDTTNVDAAGAVMNSDNSTAGMGFVVDEDNMASNSATKVPTQQSVKAYVDANSSDTTYTAGTGLSLSGTTFNVDQIALTTVQTAANESAHLALTTQEGDIVVRSDQNKSYVKNSGTAGTMADFTELLTPTGAVLSVNGNTGAITAAQIAAAVEAASDSNTFTDADHTKLNAIEASATADQTDSEIKTAYENNSNTNAFTDAEQSKLNGIASGAEVNVQADFNETDNTNDAFIKNKPTIPTNNNQLTNGAGFTTNQGTVTEVSGTSPITSSGGTTPAIGISAATTSAAGSMSSADKTKLDGIETNATADQTDAEIRAAVEAASDSNVFTDADHTKLNGIEASADVTDATNVDAAGAVMNSDLDGKGELLVGDGSGDPTALAAGTDGYVLKANSSTATGLEWAAAGSGGDANQNAFSNVAVSGQDTVAADSTTDTLNIAAGSNVTITTNASNDTVTIASTDTDITSGGTIDGDLTLTGANYNAVWDKSDNALEFADNAKAIFGGNLEIYHQASGNHSVINETGAGSLIVQAENLELRDTDANLYFTGLHDSYVSLYHHGDRRLITSSTGITVYSGASGSETATGAITSGDIGVTGDITVSGTVDGRDVAADGTKLDGIETSADVTDATNVAAAGALMDGDFTSNGFLKRTGAGSYTVDTNTYLTSVPSGYLQNLSEDTSPQLGGSLDVNGQDIVTTSNGDIELAPDGTGKTILKGNTNAGTLVFNCENNSHGQTVKAQPHSASVTNVLTLPAGADQEIVGTLATQTLTNKTLTSAVLNTGISGSAILDEDDMASNSATQLATQQSIKAYVDAEVASGGGGGVTVQDEGSALSTTATTLNFVGAGVTASGTGATKTITISGGGGGGGSGISNLVEDTTPQLGGNLDMQANNISGTGTIIANSTAVATAGMRKIYASSSAPTASDGAVGDLWVKY